VVLAAITTSVGAFFRGRVDGHREPLNAIVAANRWTADRCFADVRLGISLPRR